MSDRNNKFNRKKIDKFIKEKASKEIEKEIFKQLTEKQKQETNSYTKSYLDYYDKVIIPKQQFIYPNKSKGLNIKPNLKIQLNTFEFDTITLQNNKITKIPKKAQYYTEDLGDGIILEMIYIPAGSFLMGVSDIVIENDEYFYWGNEQPQHLVNVSDFFLGKFSTTQEQWKVIMEHNLSANPGQNLPVENTSWLDATQFCEKLSLKTGRNYRLPTEAEWEYSCRAGTTSIYNFGDTINTDVANYWDINNDRICLETKPVGSYYPNAFGLYDMHGNVYELCQDAWHDNYEGAPSDASVWGDGFKKDLVVIRGGSFDYDDNYCYCAYRSETPCNYRYHGTGFRIACSMAD